VSLRPRRSPPKIVENLNNARRGHGHKEAFNAAFKDENKSAAVARLIAYKAAALENITMLRDFEI